MEQASIPTTSQRSSPQHTTEGEARDLSGPHETDTYSARWSLALATVVAFTGVALTRLAWSAHNRFGTFGFDTGIFAQGTWLLSRGDSPFVTIRGLNLFGDHASYILAFVAPLYRLMPDVRLLLLLQTIGLVVPALVIYRIGRDKVKPRVAFAVAVAYLVYPAMNHAALWQFHPETFAAGFLSLGALCAHLKRYWLMAAALAFAVICKEDVGLVVAGFGLFLVFSGVRKVGAAVVLAGTGYFLFVTFVVIKWINGGQGSIYTARLYGIEGEGIGVALQALPQIVWHAMVHATEMDGLSYLALIFVPMLLLPLLAPKALLPIAGPLLLNLASTTGYQRSIEYQYLATSSLFIALAALYAIEKLGSVRWRDALAVALVVVAIPMAYRYGPVSDSFDAMNRPLPAVDVGRKAALKLVPQDAAISAQANTVSHIADRREVYEFPNPFRPSNWGRNDTPVAPEVRDRVKYVLIDPASLGPRDKQDYDTLRSDPTWRVFYENRVVLLKRD